MAEHDRAMAQREQTRKIQWQADFDAASHEKRLEMIELEKLRVAEKQLKAMEEQASAARSAASAAREAASRSHYNGFTYF